MSQKYFIDYPMEPFEKGGTHFRCAECGISSLEICGNLDGHAIDCPYRLAKEEDLKYIEGTEYEN